MEFELRAEWYDIIDDVYFRIAFIYEFHIAVILFNTMEFPHLTL